MGAEEQKYQSYSEVKSRLDAIAVQVADESLPLDDALDLYEEAVKLAVRASELIEVTEDDAETSPADASPAGEDDAPSQE